MRSGGNAVEVKRRPNMRCAGLAVRFDLESFLPSGREPDGVEGWGAARPKSLTEGGAAKHGRGVLHVRDRSIVCVQLGLIVRREGSVVVFTESERGCHEVYLCHAPSTILEGSANKVSVSVRIKPAEASLKSTRGVAEG